MDIRIENLTKRYGSQRAVDDISFEVKTGEILGFLGPNGAGKTTTMKVLTCYMAPTEGTVRIGNLDIFKDADQIKRHIGYLPESNPLYQEMHKQQRWDVIPGAESTEVLRERVFRGLNKIGQSHPNELVVAVVHGGVIGHIVAEATGSAPFAFNGCDNGSITKIVLVENQIVVRGFNDVSHLSDGPSLQSMPT